MKEAKFSVTVALNREKLTALETLAKGRPLATALRSLIPVKKGKRP